MSGDPINDVLHLDTTDPSGYKPNPYPLFQRLRESDPVARVVLNGEEVWLVTGYDEIKQGLSHPCLSNDTGRFGADAESRLPWQNRVLIHSDPPVHTRLRRAINKVFTPRSVECLRPRVQEITDGLVDHFIPSGQADLICDLSKPLSGAVISDLVGIPDGERDDFLEWVHVLVSDDPGLAHRMPEAMKSMCAYFEELVGRRSAELAGKSRARELVEALSQPGRTATDLISSMVALRDVEGEVDTDGVVATAFLLVAGGYETVLDGLGNGLHALLCHPDQFAMLRCDPGLLPHAVGEMLRFRSPIQTAIRRFATKPVSLGGKTIPAGASVLLALASANHDPGRFTSPERFDITRTTKGHLAFGHGIHYCIGAPLARLEMEVAIGTLLRRTSDIAFEVNHDDLGWRTSVHMHGVTRLPVRLTADAAAA